MERLTARQFTDELKKAPGWILWHNPMGGTSGELELIVREPGKPEKRLYGPDPITSSSLAYKVFISAVMRISRDPGVEKQRIV